MKLKNSYIKLTISILFAVALSTGSISIAHIQRTQAFPIDFSGLPGFGDDSGLNFFQGPKGDKGDTGEQGTSKDLEIITVSKTVQNQYDSKVSNNRNGDISVTCPEDTKVSGGGYEKTRNTNGFDITEDRPFNNGWKKSFVLIFAGEGPESLTVYAQCAK